MAEQGGLGFGGLLRRLRNDAGLTQEELAAAARVSQRATRRGSAARRGSMPRRAIASSLARSSAQ